MKVIFALIAVIALFSVAVMAADEKDSFSIGNLKGGPVHESISLSSFNAVFTKERTAKGTLHTRQQCETFAKKHERSGHKGWAYLQKSQAGKFSCENLKNYPDIETQLRSGSQWNDMPCMVKSAPWEPCMVNMLSDFMAASKQIEAGNPPPKNERGEVSVVANSHFGTKQYYHSMAPTDKDFKTARIKQKDLLEKKILHFVKVNWERACNPGYAPWALTYIARILHMVQDSYSEAHVYRTEETFVNPDTEDSKYTEAGKHTGDILFFQGYDAQDHNKHASLEGLFGNVAGAVIDRVTNFLSGNTKELHYSQVHGAVKARHQCKQIWKFWDSVVDSNTLLPTDEAKCNAVYNKVAEFLRNDVYKFAKVKCTGSSRTRSTGDMYAGGSRPDVVAGETVTMPCANQALPSIVAKTWKQFDDSKN